MDVNYEATVIDTAKRHRNGKTPKWSAADFQAIVSKNADAIVVLNHEGYVLYVNPAAESLFNLPSAEMVGASFGFPIVLDKPIELHILREFKDLVAAEMRMVEVTWAGEASYLLSFRDMTSRIMAEQAMSQSRDRLDAMVNERTHELSATNQLLIREIAERKQAELALKASEEKFRALAETTNAGIVLFRGDKFIYVNPFTEKSLGYSKDELLAMNILDIIHPDSRELVRSRGQARLQGRPVPSSYEVKVLTKAGETLWTEFSATTIDYEGQPTVIATIFDITERKLAEEALRDSQAHMSSIFRAAPTGIGVVVDRVIKEVNDRLCEMTGYASDELLGKSARVFYPSDEDYEYVGREKYRQISRLDTGSVETRWLRKDGRIIDVLLSSTPLETGNLSAGVTFTALDITDRKRDEEALRESEEKFRSIVESINEVVWETGVDGKCTYVSPKVRDLLGYGPGEVVGKTPYEFIAPEDVGRVAEAFTPRKGRHEPLGLIEYTAIRKDGGRVVIETSGSPIFDRNGSYRGYRGVNRDITGRKRAEEALVRQAMLIHLSPDAIMVRRLDGTITFWAHGAEALYGFTSDEAVGKKSHELLRTRFPEPLEDIRKRLEDKGVWTGELVHTTKDGRDVIVQSHWQRQRGDRDKAMEIFESNIDITDRKRAEEALNEAKAQAELYLDLMGHDISNMHQIIMGNLEMAQGIMEVDGRLESRDKEMIDTSMATLQRSVKLIDNIRNIQKLRSGEFKFNKMDLGEVIDSAVKSYADLPGRDISISYERVDGCYVLANPLLKDIFTNLLDNAVKYCNDPILIGVSLAPITLNGSHYYRVVVEDNGRGVPDDMKSAVFARLKRGETKVKGTGLGLYIVKTLVEGFGGTVGIEDRVPGDHAQGARFIVVLPAVEY